MLNEELVSLFQKGERNYIEDLWKQNQGLIRIQAKRYADPLNPIEDLMQIGFMGLLKAAEGFDPTLGYKFTSYASKAIMGAMYRSLYHPNCLSLDAPVNEEGDLNLLDVTKDPDAADPEEAGIRADIKRAVLKAVRESLDKPEKVIIRERFYRNPDATLEAIAEKYNTKRSEIQKIYNKAISKLRRNHYLYQIQKEFVDINTDSYGYRRGSLHSFKETWYSPVEKIVEERERQHQKLLRSIYR